MAHIGLVPDEAYYWLWSRGPSTGYYDHPPMIALWIWVSTHAFGSTPLGVRFLSVVSTAVASVAVYATVIELLDDRRIAYLATVWFNAMMLVGLEVIFATPDAPSTMFWALATWALAHLRRTGQPIWWVLIGLLAGLGCVSKYTNFFLGVGIVAWLLVDPVARRWRTSAWVLVGGMVAAAIFMPVFIWNADHDWMSFQKQFGRVGTLGARNSHLVEFLAGQLGLLNPLLAVFAGIGIWQFVQQRKSMLRDPQLLLVALNAPLLFYLLVHSLHDNVHPNWTAPAYPGLAIMAARVAHRSTTTQFVGRLTHWVSPVGLGLPCLLFAIFASPLGGYIPFRSPADTALGWHGLYAQLDAMRRLKGAEWIATTDYGLTGELAFQARDDSKILEVVDRYRYTYQTPDKSLAGKPALLVISAGDDRLDEYRRCFQSSSSIEVLHRSTGYRSIETYFVMKVSRPPEDVFSIGCARS
jgi:4-amino-4-deoxy-L-arabinose transferase-like glycosyltransferase